MNDRILDKMWQDFREKSRLNNVSLSQQQAMEYAFKCGAAAGLLQLNNLPQNKVNLTVHSIMNEFGEFIRDRMLVDNVSENN